MRRLTTARRPGDPPRTVLAAYGLLGLLLTAYFGSVVARGQGHSFPLLDGWLVAAFELTASGLCMARALWARQGRIVPLTLGCALLAWSLGDVVLTAESAGGVAPGAPSLADLFYLGFYPLAYLALGLLLRRHAGRLVPATWLDGAVAGFGASAVFACFAFNPILSSVGGDAASVATNLAYPVGDVLLLVLVVGGLALLPGRRNTQWFMFAAACVVNAAGDTFNLFDGSGPGSQVGTLLNAVAWPISILLISGSVWTRPAPVNLLREEGRGWFLLPSLGAAAGLVILVIAAVHDVTLAAVGLAAATEVAVGARMGLSFRQLRSLTEKRHHQAITDELTGLGNRRLLFHLLDAFFADDAQRPGAGGHLSLLFIDLDHFKEINDSFGHAAGDELLRQLGPRLAGSLRGTDILVRVGGEELAVVTTDTDSEYAVTVARRLMAELDRPFVIDAVSVRISARVGIATAPGDARDSTSLLRCADLAMYRAKSGRSHVETYRPDIDDSGNRLDLVDELRLAVEGGHFELHYQPQLDCRTNQVVGVEALLRWPHPRHGFVAPLAFLPLAEEAGLMLPLTAWVLEEAAAQCATWHAAGKPITISVNVSVTNLFDPDFVGSVTAVLERHRLAPGALILEITETSIIKDFDECRLVIARLRKLGLGISIDDFGAGFTSLAYLGSLAVSELKLDRTFITALADADDGRNQALVRATIELGHALKLRVVAEGIEDGHTLDVLGAMGCDVAQGFFIGKPLPSPDLARRPTVPARAMSTMSA